MAHFVALTDLDNRPLIVNADDVVYAAVGRQVDVSIKSSPPRFTEIRTRDNGIIFVLEEPETIWRQIRGQFVVAGNSAR